ncbi:TenA family protein [Sulfurisphaera tokodaii]|uniref:Transcriptional activator TenA homolog n=2 Tax=Sulfurisphaera tokodaii TaxID=111955 RepID=Q974H1_SULTO|nr:TenA family protein [Sulfurisphaera tokodaii]BAB65687.1 transcriptional activator TenA homolog [Sulfurisphaera tokodaii str. 7]HII74534.1 TenA family protein [Sulfurisphaera tokodaii]
MMRLSEFLRENSPWEEYVNHEFVKEMIEGTLPQKKFRYYLLQDAKYVEEMLRALLRASALAPLDKSLKLLHVILSSRDKGTEVNNYLYSRLGITQDEIRRTKMNDVNYAYTRHLNYWAERSWELFLVAWTPCMWGYFEIGKKVVNSTSELYKAWASFYSSDDYKKRVDIILENLDSIEVDKDLASEIFNRSVKYEIQFWDSALTI